MKTFITKSVPIVIAIILSGLFWFISNGLNGDYWYLLWIAPVPVLLISLRTKAYQSFFMAFLAYLTGRFSWFGYLASVLAPVPAIILIIVLSLIFAAILVITRSMILKTNYWFSVFAFPVFFTAFEWLLINFSPDGSAASIAYSQSDFLPFIQIASFTGILGITFIATLIPSAIAVGWYLRKEKMQLLPLSVTTIVVMVSVFLFGLVRISHGAKSDKLTAGLVVLDEDKHQISDPDFSREPEIAKIYTQEIGKLAVRGAKLVVLPERALNINKDSDSAVMEILSSCAKQNHVYIVAGFTDYRSHKNRNSALVIDGQGNLLLDYVKIHLIKVLEDQFTPGNKIGSFTFNGSRTGVAICKDLDFSDYIKQYGKEKVDFLCIPAWDFVVDDWLHSRMAILRGVENGFSEVRTARLGRLTITDPFGRVIAEANSSKGKTTVLIGQVPMMRTDTFYARHPDWFGFLILSTAFVFIILILFKRKIQTKEIIQQP